MSLMSEIIDTINDYPSEIGRLHALIELAEDWGIKEPHDPDGTSLHSILTVLCKHSYKFPPHTNE